MSLDLNPRFTFDTFVTGGGNRLAVTAARTVAETPATAYNPLFIYSDTGLGKTHLVMAIGHAARALNSSITVEYVTLEEFIEAFHAAVAAGQGEAFRNRFTGVDIVLLDDVQFLTNRRETQAELLRFITEFLSLGRQVVLTSDRSPTEIEHLDERLISRFAGGLVVDIGPPEYETRLAILNRKAEERGMALGGDVLAVAAEFESRNVRELLGLLNRLIAFQAVSEGPLTGESARSLLLGEGVQPGKPAETPAPQPSQDEFSQFLHSVGSALERSVEAWRLRVRESAVFWEGQGYRIGRLTRVLEQETALGSDEVIKSFETDVERLKELEQLMSSVDLSQAGDPVFRDPDRVADAEALVQRAQEGLAPPPGPSAAWAFEGFIVSDANKVALNSARAVAENPGVLYNPLVIVGPTGVGKTHLLHAVGHALSTAPDALVACLSAQDFVDELVQALERDRLDAWRSRYRRATAFLLDDAQLLAGKERTQEELFHLFNSFVDSQRQLVFTVSQPSREVEGLDDRLISRLEGGLVVEITEPDRALRLEVVTRELGERVGFSDPDLAAYLADRPAHSLRSVVALVQRVIEAAEAQGTVPSAAQAREVLEGTEGKPRRSTGRMRTSGIVVSPSSGIRSQEKVIWRWPDVAQRVMEDVG